MILLQSHSRFLIETLYRVLNLFKPIELDYNWVEFGDVRYHVQVTTKNPKVLLLSVSLPIPPPETVFVSGLPFGAIEAIKSAYGSVVQILDPPKDGFNLTLKINLTKLPTDQELKQSLLMKIASVRDVVLGAPLSVVLKHLASRTVAPGTERLVALVHRPNESFFLLPLAERVTVIFPMRFSDSVDTTYATSFLQFFLWEDSDLQYVLVADSGSLSSVTFPYLNLDVDDSLAFYTYFNFLSGICGNETYCRTYQFSFIYPRHVDGRRLDRTVWNLSTFHAYVSYHVKCTEAFMHTRMRRRVEGMIQALDQAKPESEDKAKSPNDRSFKRLSINEGRTNAKS
ncbi:Actin-related protein 2/3 complex subunit 2A [Linum perenne]